MPSYKPLKSADHNCQKDSVTKVSNKPLVLDMTLLKDCLLNKKLDLMRCGLMNSVLTEPRISF